MNPAFKHHGEQLPADIPHLFLHKLGLALNEGRPALNSQRRFKLI